MIVSSLQWNSERQRILDSIPSEVGFKVYFECRKVLDNISEIVRELSKAEVVARQSKSVIRVNELLCKVNDAISEVERQIFLTIILQ